MIREERPTLAAWPYELSYRLRLHRFFWHRDDPPGVIVDWDRQGKIPGARVLEIGAGLASIGLWLARNGRTVTAIDFSPRAVALARARARALRLALDAHVVDATRGDPALGRYDLIVDCECLQDIRSDRDRSRYADSVRRWLAPSGRLVVVTWLLPPRGQRRLPFPVSRLPEDEVPNLFSGLRLEERCIAKTSLYGIPGRQAAFRLSA
jgi:SAM-dependent methyltransferase